MKTIPMMLAAAIVLAPVAAVAHNHMPKGQATGSAQGGMNHGGMDHGAVGHAMKPDPSNPYAKSEMDMHQRMMGAKGGNASETWTRKMIEHHRGAVSMSRVALTAASDASVRQMAQMTIDKQEKDIAELQAMLRTMGKPAQ